MSQVGKYFFKIRKAHCSLRLWIFSHFFLMSARRKDSNVNLFIFWVLQKCFCHFLDLRSALWGDLNYFCFRVTDKNLLLVFRRKHPQKSLMHRCTLKVVKTSRSLKLVMAWRFDISLRGLRGTCSFHFSSDTMETLKALLRGIADVWARKAKFAYTV